MKVVALVWMGCTNLANSAAHDLYTSVGISVSLKPLPAFEAACRSTTYVLVGVSLAYLLTDAFRSTTNTTFVFLHLGVL